MNLAARVAHLEEKANSKNKVWLTLFNDDDRKEAIAKYEHEKGLHLEPSQIRWIKIETVDL